MTQIGDAIARYHQLFEHDGYRDLGWAEELQDRMRQQRLTDSGRLISPVLRPQFISRRQFEHLTVTERLVPVLERAAAAVLQSSALLARLHMLPAEKMLAAVPTNGCSLAVACRMDAQIQNGSLWVRALNTSKPKGFAYCDDLASLFLALPIMKAFKRGRYRLSKVDSRVHLHSAALEAWEKFGGKGAPTLGVLELGEGPRAHSEEGQSLVELLKRSGLSSRLVSPHTLEFRNGKLRDGDFEIDIVLRRVLTRELLAYFDLSHPLLTAYRAHAVCVINDFRSEIAQRPAFLDLLTDEDAIPSLTSADRKIVRSLVPWTRVVSARKTRYNDQVVDLPEFLWRNRERFVLIPNDDSGEHRTYVGTQMRQSGWENAVRNALRIPYVAQEQARGGAEPFPIFQYGQLQMKNAHVAVQPHFLNGQFHGATAGLETYSTGCATPLAIAPVLLLEEN